MDSVLTLCLVFLSGLMIGALLGAVTIALCFSAKKADAAFEFDTGVGYPRHEA